MPTTTWTPLATPNSASTTTTPITTPFVRDTFSDVSGVGLLEHIGEVGASWSRHPVISNGSVRISGDGSTYPLVNSWFVPSGVPPSADYTVTANIVQRSRTPLTALDLLVRSSSTVFTCYGARYATTDDSWEMYKVVAGTVSVLTNKVESLVTGQTYQMRFVVQGSNLSLYVDNVLKIASVDTRLTAAGVVSLTQEVVGAAGNTTGLQAMDFTAETTETSVVTTVTPTPHWDAASAANTTWGASSHASTTWSTLT